MEAVQDCEAIEDHTALAIMYAIARHADVKGVAGANGKDSSPSMETIARKARCHKNTVLNWIPKLEEMNVLRVERFGKGRGSWNRYTLLVPINAENGTSNGTTHDVPKTDLLVQELSDKIDLLVQVMVHNGTTQDVPDTKDTKENIYIHPEPDEIVALETAVSQISKTPKWEKTQEEYTSAAYTLLGWDATPSDIAGFGVWWQKNGYYPGKPALSSLIGEWQNYASGLNKASGKVKKSFKLVDTNGNAIDEVVLNV